MIKNIEHNEVIEQEKDLSKFIIPNDEINKNLDDFLSGKIPKGYVIGVKAFDNHFVFKKNELYAITGKKGAGKTTINQAIQIMGSIANDLIWVVAFQENANWAMKLNYMGYFLGEFAANIRETDRTLYDLAIDWIDKHFIFIEVDDVKTALDVTKELIDNGTDVHALLLDPINSFTSGYSNSGNGHTDGLITAIEMIKFTKKICSLYVTQHPTMANQRKGEVVSSYDAEGGWYLNKADFTCVIHREKGTSQNELIVESVRNLHTGGAETDTDNPVVITWSPNKIDISYKSGFDLEINVIQKLVRFHNPLGIEYKELEKEKLPNLTTDEAFDDVPF